MTRKQVNMVIRAICDRGLIFVEGDNPISKDRITEKYMLSEIIPYTVEQLVCIDLDVVEE